VSAPLRFVFVLHIHQPVGNFDFVFREHADDVYTPFLDFLDERELWPIGLHVSGPLLEWLGTHDRNLHDRIGRLAADGKVELLSAGWYEPILASLNPTDRATQLGWMRDELVSRFGVTPRGVWLTERVWTQPLAGDLADAGIDYTFVDDHLLRRVGATSEQLLRPFTASHDGRSVNLFSIDEGLRYLIPFRPADRVAADFRRRHAEGEPLALFADDGEKFGGWPRTREWLYDEGWLEAFGDEMDTLRAEGILRLTTPAQALDALGRECPDVDLPIGSYSEMDEWARGPWTNFLDRYDEAGRLHTWMSDLSDRCRRAGDPPAVRRAVGRAQCNDAYWHGVFGGLYMKHLREGVRYWMAEAERGLARAGGVVWDRASERDGAPAHAVRSPRVCARVTGQAGGTLTQLVWLEPHLDVTDVLTRRLETYHEVAVARGREAARDAAGDSGGSASIHEIEEGAVLDALPPSDPDVRVLVRDRVLGPEVEFRHYAAGVFEPLWSAPDAELSDPDRRSDRAGRERRDADENALVWSFAAPSLHVAKRISLTEDRVEIEWSWDPARFPPGAWVCPEFSFGCAVDLAFDPPPAATWTYPIVTVSKCPDGFEDIEQGTSITPRWPTALAQVRAVLSPPASEDGSGG
jgi:hypothetical protein